MNVNIEFEGRPAIIMELIAPAHTGQRFSAPIYLREYNAEGGDGVHGAIRTTLLPSEAHRFASVIEAHDAYRAINKKHPTRPDGQPNRPLTAFTVSIFPLVELLTKGRGPL